MDTATSLISQKLNKIQNVFCSHLYIDYCPTYRNSILLAGYARSGTTWVSEVINYRNEYRYVFEPFNPDQVSLFRDLEFGNAKYLRPNFYDRKLIEVFNYVLSGKLRNNWSDQFNKKFISSKRFIKAVRSNLFLNWLYHSFPGIPIIFLVRHPCAVANSRLKLNWSTSMDKYLVQNELMEDYLNPFRSAIEQARDNNSEQGDFERAIFAWCIENYVPLTQFKNNEICILFYEELCTDPEAGIDRIFSFLNKEYNLKDILSTFGMASSMSRSDSSIKTGENLIGGWRKYIQNHQLERVNEILNLFGLDKIYSEALLPQTKNLSKVVKV